MLINPQVVRMDMSNLDPRIEQRCCLAPAQPTLSSWNSLPERERERLGALLLRRLGSPEATYSPAAKRLLSLRGGLGAASSIFERDLSGRGHRNPEGDCHPPPSCVENVGTTLFKSGDIYGFDLGGGGGWKTRGNKNRHG